MPNIDAIARKAVTDFRAGRIAAIEVIARLEFTLAKS